ncbi:PREDICTED: uncharacterized protein LOC109179053 [Ipomoea nil]|uniref:uncharacterized protein LOC109179053 n=1 Tax=Ipomoea nil TaxID=35883 RepID=UPI000900B685|nr:PREDICTED: uncharacterized protein LOC109179053 [Ipomoea nil]
MRPSGANDADVIVRALEEYKQKHGREKFGYEHVWAIVKDLPSWQPQYPANQTSTGSVAGTASGSEEVFPRPIGRKAAKRKSKERYSNDDHVESEYGPFENLDEMLEKYRQIRKESDGKKLESDERKMEMKEYKILMKDTSNMTEQQLANHLEYCNDIRRRRQNAKRS